MSYILGNIILPYPKKLTRQFIETSAENALMEGRTTKRVENRKEVFLLEYQHLSQSQVNSLLSEYEMEAVRTFTVNETNLAIGPTDVLVDIKGREYPPSGAEYKENLILVLSEVK